MAYVGKHWRIRGYIKPDRTAYYHTTVWALTVDEARAYAVEWMQNVLQPVLELEVR